mmetsp:Transcript_31707/g.62750  ORF Transcript_31707/g.62750 Transcript_31707/m.62750 type:complete len:213 (+) Transcript_31707:212-850(+)
MQSRGGTERKGGRERWGFLLESRWMRTSQLIPSLQSIHSFIRPFLSSPFASPFSPLSVFSVLPFLPSLSGCLPLSPFFLPFFLVPLRCTCQRGKVLSGKGAVRKKGLPSCVFLLVQTQLVHLSDVQGSSKVGGGGSPSRRREPSSLFLSSTSLDSFLPRVTHCSLADHFERAEERRMKSWQKKATQESGLLFFSSLSPTSVCMNLPPSWSFC